MDFTNGIPGPLSQTMESIKTTKIWTERCSRFLQKFYILLQKSGTPPPSPTCNPGKSKWNFLALYEMYLFFSEILFITQTHTSLGPDDDKPHIMDFTHGIPGPSTTLKTPMTNETQNNRSIPHWKDFTHKIPGPCITDTSSSSGPRRVRTRFLQKSSKLLQKSGTPPPHPSQSKFGGNP